jgi:CO dehydrogenase maturation factor
MSKIIALAGKGGVGKTTVAALIARYFTKDPSGALLAIDADPNSNLGETLGLTIEKTVGDIREDFMRDPQGVPSGMDKVVYIESLMNQIIVEHKNFDLLVMGRQEGQGCYCMVNNILNRFADELEKNYAWLLVDNEAGMEHLSRRTSGRVDILLMVTDYAFRGLRAVDRINSMLGGLKLDVRHKGLIVNRAPENLSPAFKKEVESIKIPILCTIPDDKKLLEFDMEKRSLLELPDDSPALSAISDMMTTIKKMIA